MLFQRSGASYEVLQKRSGMDEPAALLELQFGFTPLAAQRLGSARRNKPYASGRSPCILVHPF